MDDYINILRYSNLNYFSTTRKRDLLISTFIQSIRGSDIIKTLNLGISHHTAVFSYGSQEDLINRMLNGLSLFGYSDQYLNIRTWSTLIINIPS